jgi:RNA polymerase sigma factor (sigma-70 family)
MPGPRDLETRPATDTACAAGVGATVAAVWRIESAKLIAGLARIVRDLGVAEELAQDALVAALERWPESGVPDNPGAWLMATAKHRAVDLIRRRERLERKHEEIGRQMEADQAGQTGAEPDFDAIDAADQDVGDDLLRLILAACHPVLTQEARVALTLRLLGGLTTTEIARAFLVPEPTVAQRIVRAKRTLSEARVPFEVPKGAELAGRMASVLEVIYLIFNEGYAATAGDDWMRPGLCEDALRLGRILAELAPSEPEVHGLAALMEIQASRMRARAGPRGSPSSCSTRTAAGGTTSSSAGGSRPSTAPSDWKAAARRGGRTRSRLRSPPAMRGPARRRRRTGNGLRRSTRSSQESRRRRSSSSTEPSPSRWPTARPRGWR